VNISLVELAYYDELTRSYRATAEILFKICEEHCDSKNCRLRKRYEQALKNLSSMDFFKLLREYQALLLHSSIMIGILSHK